MEKTYVLERVITTLHEAGWRQAFTPNTCFDVYGRGEEDAVLVKAQGNVDSTTKAHAAEMKQAALFLGAAPLIVGERNSRGELQEQTVYERYGIPALNADTLHAYLDLKQPATKINTRGGTYVPIDEEQFEAKRRSEGYSLNALALEIGVSTTTIRTYREDGRATPEKAERLQEVLGDVTASVNVFRTTIQVNVEPTTDASKRLARIGLDAAGFDTAPFDAAAKDDEDRFVAKEAARSMDDKLLAFLRDVTELADSHPFIIGDDEYGEVASLSERTLRDVDDKDELKEEISI